LIAIILPPIVSAILGAIYDWEIAGAAALLGLLILPATLLFAALNESSVRIALFSTAATGIAIGLIGAVPLVKAEEAAVSLARFCLALHLATLGVSLLFLISIRKRILSG
jgi:hypothetical protein